MLAPEPQFLRVFRPLLGRVPDAPLSSRIGRNWSRYCATIRFSATVAFFDRRPDADARPLPFRCFRYLFGASPYYLSLVSSK